MAITLTHTQIRSVQAGPLFRVDDNVTAATGIQTQVFVFLVSDDSFNRVATVADMDLLPTSHAAAVAGGNDAYRLAHVIRDYDALDTAEDAAGLIRDRLKLLLVQYDSATNAFVGTTTETLSS